ncbi:MAG: hypothetical protein MH137_11090 [Flavobacteriales bacterium]|nr:hypothetical protein [Flavobacteriales bacterium]
MELFARVFQTLHNRFVYDISHTGQVASMEHYLNDQYSIVYNMATRSADIANGDIIWIDSGLQITPVYLYNKAELKQPIYIRNKSESEPPVYLRNKAEGAGYEFIVYVPSALTWNQAQLDSQIKKYKQAGARYIIQVY